MVSKTKSVATFSKLLEYGLMAQASEHRLLNLPLNQRRIADSLVLQAVQADKPQMLTSKGKSHLNNKKTRMQRDLNLIRSNGTKRKFFLRDQDVRKSLNKRQEKLLNKALKARS